MKERLYLTFSKSDAKIFWEKIARRPGFFDPNPLYLLCYLLYLEGNETNVYFSSFCIWNLVRDTGCFVKYFLVMASD